MPPRADLPTLPTAPHAREAEPDAETACSRSAAGECATPPPTHIGRYVVQEQVGHGGMGTVYRAFDPALDRDIALKLLRGRGSDNPTGALRDQDRIFREAQALAKLSHPNIIAVHDVGTFGAEVFVAMELVRGQTVLDWLRERPRGWREVVAVFGAAGDGLAAAHAAGLVHRDVKPSNLLLGDDGRVRVIDFGLARAAALDAADPIEVADTPDADGALRAVGSIRRPLVAQPLTTIGTLCGTPQYMAPEQRLRGHGGEAADQFSLCAALYEALYGERPYRDDGQPARPSTAAAERRGRANDKVPAHIHEACMRGLAVQPAERFGSIAELLTALRRDSAARRRQVAIAAGIAVLATLAGFALAQRGAVADRCPVDEPALRAMWNPEAAAAIANAFAATGRPYAADTAERVNTALAERASAWAAMQTQACEATWVKGTQSEALLDLRIQCLAERRDEQVALVELLSGAAIDAEAVDRATQAVTGLPALASCGDVEALRATHAPPPPDTAQKVAALRKQVAQVRVRRLAGDYRSAVVDGGAVVEAVSAIDYPPLLGEATYEHARALRGAGEFSGAQAALERAMEAAGAAGDDRTAALAAAEWLSVVGWELDRRDDALLSVPMARTLAARRPDDVLVQVNLHNGIGTCLHAAHDAAGAQAEYRRALRLVIDAGGAMDSWRPRLHNNIGLMAENQGDYETAIRELEQARDMWRAELGPQHPNVAIALSNLGYSEAALDRHQQALTNYTKALQIWESALGTDHPRLAEPLAIMSESLSAIGRVNAAAAAAERSLRIRERSLGPGHAMVGYSAEVLAGIRLEQAKPTEAVTYYRRAIAAFEPAHPNLVGALLGLGRGLAATGRDLEALAARERAVAFAAERELPTLPDAEAALARALWRSGARTRARAIADKALAAFEAAGRKQEQEELAQWLAAQR